MKDTNRRMLRAILSLCLATSPAGVFADCVISPNPPTPPPGCLSMEPDCICDVQGQDCHWVFHCIRSRTEEPGGGASAHLPTNGDSAGSH